MHPTPMKSINISSLTVEEQGPKSLGLSPVLLHRSLSAPEVDQTT
jgi:hypothetical protein